MDCDQSRGRGRGSPRGSPGRSGGRKFMGSGFQSQRHYDPQSGGYSRGRGQKLGYVAKHQKGQKPSEEMTAFAEEVNSLIACDLAHNRNGPPLSSPHGSSWHTGEEETQFGETSREVKYDNVTLTSDFPNKLDISRQQDGDCQPLKHGDEDGPLSIKSPKTPASDRPENLGSSSAFVPFDICKP